MTEVDRRFKFAHGFSEAVKTGEVELWADRSFPGAYESFPFAVREIFPSLYALRSPILMFEVLGHERSGKSTFVEYLKATGLEGTHLIVQPEFDTRNPQFTKYARRILHRKHFSGSNVELAKLKLMVTDDGIEKAIDLLAKMDNGKIKHQPIILVTERGPQDALAYFLYDSLLNWSDDSELASRHNEDMPIQGFEVALLYSELVTASVFFQDSIETAMHRRELQGIPREGYMTNPKIRELTNRAYGSWLGQIYPAFRGVYGAGLKVIDGEKPIEENNKDAMGYLLQVIKEARRWGRV
jgi:hypothetical protein